MFICRVANFCSMFQEEVWEVAAQLIGLGLGILIIVFYLLVWSFPHIYYLEVSHRILAKSFSWFYVERLYTIILMQDTPGLVKSFPFVSLTWTSIRIVHLWLRYQSLVVLQFNTVRVLKWIFLQSQHEKTQISEVTLI